MARNPHFRVDDMSEAARRIIRDGIERNRREIEMRAQVQRETGERIASSSLNRYASWYRLRLRERELIKQRVEVAVETAGKLGEQMTAGMQAELLEVFYSAAREGKLGEIGPYFAGKLALALAESQRKDRELRVREAQLELNRREVALAEQKLAAALEREQRAAAEAEALEAKAASGGQVTADDIARLRQVYGLKPRAESGSESAA